MGVYNTILVECPECGEILEFQTKSGSCALRHYHISKVPEEDIKGILGDSICCYKCETKVTIGKEKIKPKDFSHLVDVE